LGAAFFSARTIGLNPLVISINDQRATVHTMTRRLPWSLT